MRDQSGRLIRSGKFKKQTLYPNRMARHSLKVTLGSSLGLKAGTYTLRVRFITKSTTWRSIPTEFRQRY